MYFLKKFDDTWLFGSLNDNLFTIFRQGTVKLPTHNKLFIAKYTLNLISREKT